MSFNGEPDGDRRVKFGPLASRRVAPVVFTEPPAPAPEPEPEPVAEPESEEPYDEELPPHLGVAATISWVSVGGARGRARAQTALAAEKASKGARTHLIAELEAILNTNEE